MKYLAINSRASNMVICCPFSLECLTETADSPRIFCRNYESCPALLFCERIEKESPAFWKLILNVFNAINPGCLDVRLLMVGINKGLEIERKNFLSLLLLYFIKKDLAIFSLISQEDVEMAPKKVKSSKEIFREMSDESPILSEIISDNFSDLLLSDFSQKGILHILDIFCKAEKKSKKPIPQPSDALFKSINSFLESRFE